MPMLLLFAGYHAWCFGAPFTPATMFNNPQFLEAEKNRRRAGNLLSPDRPETSLRLLSRTLSRLPPAAGGDSRLSPAAPPRPRGGMVCRGRVSRRSLDQRRIQRLARRLHHHGPLSDPAGAVSDFPRRDVAASKPPLPSPAAGSRRPLLL
ncbi:MAG: hypothetical protein L6W00_21615 [Lentisphaeria bacterium]|nr:MAG: hypothetical protein L6W00_21615 [Lentisphaeria bacterium]